MVDAFLPFHSVVCLMTKNVIITLRYINNRSSFFCSLSLEYVSESFALTSNRLENCSDKWHWFYRQSAAPFHKRSLILPLSVFNPLLSWNETHLRNLTGFCPSKNDDDDCWQKNARTSTNNDDYEYNSNKASSNRIRMEQEKNIFCEARNVSTRLKIRNFQSILYGCVCVVLLVLASQASKPATIWFYAMH